jgi:nicotinate-nucleotide adenylyltransferase
MGATVGILGGTFDPPHNAHLHLAGYARDHCPLARVMLIPARVPPHKARPNIAPPQDRLRMLELAAAGREGLEVSRIELDREGPSYTAETLRSLREDHPETEFRIIMGADMLPDLHLWKDAAEVLRLGRPIVATRPGAALCEHDLREILHPSLRGFARQLEDALLQLPPMDISSTEIRRRIAEGEPLGGLLPPGVIDYIRAKNLYAGP